MMITSMRIISMLAVFLSICLASDASSPKSHDEILQDVALTIIASAVVDDMKISSTTLLLADESVMTAPRVRSALIQTLLEKQNRVFTAPANCDTVLTCNTIAMILTYGEPFSTSFFSSRQVPRTISLTVDFSLRSTITGQVLFARQYSGSSTDTVSLSVTEELNEPAVPFSAIHRFPSSFFDSILEPAIITVASAVAVYLFFTIRS